MEIDDHFDPVDFYYNDPLNGDQVTSTINNIATEESTENIINNQPINSNNDHSFTRKNHTSDEPSNLRRSGRPKPAAESLISSPPAIKFYKSTVIRKSKSGKPSPSLSSSRSALRNKNSVDGSPVANSKVLKLRLSSSDSATQIGGDGEMTPKRNLRVVKLMMPDITEDDHSRHHHQRQSDHQQHHPQLASSFSNPNSNIKLLPLLAPKPAKTNANGQVSEIIKMKEFKLRERKVAKTNRKEGKDAKKREKSIDDGIESAEMDADTTMKNTSNPAKPTSDPNIKASGNVFSKPDPPVQPQPSPHIINEDVCSSCGGLGNFICCDACPRSFHFTCAEPPLDPQNLPEDDWYCNECRHNREKSNNSDDLDDRDKMDIWGLMTGKVGRMNPECFVMPRRFRYQPKEEDLIKLQTGQIFNNPSSLSATTLTTALNSHVQPSPTNSSSTHIVINNLVKIDHCGYELVAPDISSLKSLSGYCHFCGRFGLTKVGLTKTEELNNVPSDPRYHRPIISCSICPLYWHLDCLDMPLVNFPPSSVIWTCPVHFTTEKCIALDVAESLVQASTLLPESAIRLQFRRKAERLKEEQQREDRDDFMVEDEFEKMYGVTNCINVPENIKSTYQ